MVQLTGVGEGNRHAGHLPFERVQSVGGQFGAAVDCLVLNQSVDFTDGRVPPINLRTNPPLVERRRYTNSGMSSAAATARSVVSRGGRLCSW